MDRRGRREVVTREAANSCWQKTLKLSHTERLIFLQEEVTREAVNSYIA
jgi:hypothetical protein